MLDFSQDSLSPYAQVPTGERMPVEKQSPHPGLISVDARIGALMRFEPVDGVTPVGVRFSQHPPYAVDYAPRRYLRNG